ncbi:MAG: hypothetical protein KatS3mg003_0235 [Candidatus Nitrosocaldaceae archaeon]|nr:MAG: hypothetical protein KatS3mg003_0235 [Candidatus Nitrosocaldaceae archaeon]
MKREEYLKIFDDNCIIHGFPHGFEGKQGLEQFYNHIKYSQI